MEKGGTDLRQINSQGFRDREHAIAKPPDRDEVQAKGAKFLVVTGSMLIQVSPDPDARQEYMNRLSIRSLFYPDQRIKALGDHEGFKVLNLAPGLEDYASRNKSLFTAQAMQKGEVIGMRSAIDWPANSLPRNSAR